MFKALKHLLKGTYSTRHLEYLARQGFFDFKLRGDKNVLGWRTAKENPEILEICLDDLRKGFELVAQENSRHSQKIALRKISMKHLMTYTYFNALWSEDFSDEDRSVILEKTDESGDLGWRNLQSFLHKDAYVIFQEVICLRMLEYIRRILFDDSAEESWVPIYVESSETRFKTQFRWLIDNDPVTHTFVDVYSSLMSDLEKKILSGAEWDYKAIKLEEEQRVKEALDADRESLSALPSRKFASSSQLDSLSEFLIERIDRLAKGDVYHLKMGESSKTGPSELSAVMQIDLGLVLVGLSECIEEEDEAARIVRKCVEKIKEHYSSADSNSYDLSTSIEIKNIYLREGISTACLLAASMLWPALSPEEGNESKELSELRTSIGMHIIDDMLEVIHFTKKIFGKAEGEFQRMFS